MHILLITRHYPPEISGGARRPNLYAHALKELGHRVTVVTPFKVEGQDSITVKNTAILNGLKALHDKDSVSDPKGIFTRLKAHLRPWVYWPDDNIGWVNDVIRTVKRQGLQPDWIMTTSPPESIHLAGAKLSKLMRVPWVAELRDTWVEQPHRQVLAESGLRAFLERRIAKKTLKTAKAITAVSEAVIGEARNYTNVNTPECVISHFSDPPRSPYKFDPSNLNFVHTGGFTLSDRRRTLQPLLSILDQISLTRPNLVFHIAGPLSEDEVSQIETSMTKVEWHGSVTLPKARALQAGADALILYTPVNSHALPGKYAEYALAGKPILYLGGGQWRELVEDPSLLRPLESAALTIEKNETIIAKNALTHIQAAQNLVDFLKSVDV